MIVLTASKSCLTASRRELLVEGAVNVNIVQFVFSPDWDGLTKTAVFQAGSDKYSVLLDESNETQIPWEVLQNPRRTLYAGVYGTVGGDLVLPTIWASLGTIQEGATPGQDTQPPTPTVYEQLLADIGNLDDLDTNAKDSLVAAINEVFTTGGGGGFPYKIGNGLKVTGGDTLEVNTADDVEQDNTLPITSAAVYTTVGNIEALLSTI